MRLKRGRLKGYHHKARDMKKDNEGGTYEEYGAARFFTGEVWPSGGKLQAEVYGERLPYIRNIRIEGDYVFTVDRTGVLHYVYPGGLEISEGDGLCLYVSADKAPDYRIISCKPYRHLVLEAERVM